eukprot:CAMPEP_0117652726 /NCGR_PEP_ID=MMETSP0804-20121206/2788_1 /TAXON_ID=1074897 /ORGANISM="Tetraselmis astigmatica, Strain CCMP880" /LENGTH=129 /DNA_ID=CAMNT_0005458807 /DNA_START=114 /DNA_END=503 /DNA_ORIENTATION=+
MATTLKGLTAQRPAATASRHPQTRRARRGCTVMVHASGHQPEKTFVGRRSLAATLALVLPLPAALLVAGKATAGGVGGLNDCDPICGLDITKSGDNEYASMMAALAERRKAAAEAQKEEATQTAPDKTE